MFLKMASFFIGFSCICCPTSRDYFVVSPPCCSGQQSTRSRDRVLGRSTGRTSAHYAHGRYTSRIAQRHARIVPRQLDRLPRFVHFFHLSTVAAISRPFDPGRPAKTFHCTGHIRWSGTDFDSLRVPPGGLYLDKIKLSNFWNFHMFPLEQMELVASPRLLRTPSNKSYHSTRSSGSGGRRYSLTPVLPTRGILSRKGSLSTSK